MSLVAEFSLPADDFVLGDALQLDSIDRIEFDCKIPARNNSMPYFWVWGSQFDEFDVIAESEVAIAYIELIDQLEDSRLYRAEWKHHISTLLEATQLSNSRIRNVTGEREWKVEVSFEQHDDLTTFSDHYTDSELDLALERVYSLSNTFDERYDVTPAQREALITAERAGYYNEPSDVSMEELADELGVSLAAVSGRLRRGTSTLIRRTLL